jgi:glycosyltransferase involved in cell wall biosynthesis
LKIAFLIELFYPHMAGCERRFFEIGKRLVKKGHEVSVFTLQYDRNLPQEEFIEGIEVHRCAYSTNYVLPNGSRSLSGVLKYSLGAFKELWKQGYDAYYSNQWPMIHSIIVKPVASPLIQEWCEVWSGSIRAMMVQKTLKALCEHHVAVSEFTKRRLATFLGLDGKRVSVVPNGVDYQKLCRDSKEKVWGRIVYLGRIVPHKHVEMLVDAFRIVKEKAPQAELHIIGSGPCLPSIKDQASRIKDCYVHGFLPDDEMLELLKSSWLFVLPSEREGSSIAALEGMAAGLPIVTCNYPNNAAKELANHKCGIAVNPDSVSIASALLQFFTDGGMWKETSCYASRFAAEHDWDSVTNQMEHVLRKVSHSVEK